MVLKETCAGKYKLINTLGFKGVEFTESSRLEWLKAVKFAADQNAVLQSVREAAAFQIEKTPKRGMFPFRDYAFSDQVTRTGAIYFKDGSKFYVAFDDAPYPQQNIILARVQEGYDAHSNDREWMLSKKDKHVAQILKRAEKSDRIVEVVESPLELATNTSSGVSEFGSNKTVQALFGNVAEPYAGTLHKNVIDAVVIYVLTPDCLDKTLDQKNAVVLGVRLGGFHRNDISSSVYALEQFNYYDYARGVRGARKFSR